MSVVFRRLMPKRSRLALGAVPNKRCARTSQISAIDRGLTLASTNTTGDARCCWYIRRMWSHWWAAFSTFAPRFPLPQIHAIGPDNRLEFFLLAIQLPMWLLTGLPILPAVNSITTELSGVGLDPALHQQGQWTWRALSQWAQADDRFRGLAAAGNTKSAFTHASTATPSHETGQRWSRL